MLAKRSPVVDDISLGVVICLELLFLLMPTIHTNEIVIPLSVQPMHSNYSNKNSYMYYDNDYNIIIITYCNTIK